MNTKRKPFRGALQHACSISHSSCSISFSLADGTKGKGSLVEYRINLCPWIHRGPDMGDWGKLVYACTCVCVCVRECPQQGEEHLRKLGRLAALVSLLILAHICHWSSSAHMLPESSYAHRTGQSCVYLQWCTAIYSVDATLSGQPWTAQSSNRPNTNTVPCSVERAAACVPYFLSPPCRATGASLIEAFRGDDDKCSFKSAVTGNKVQRGKCYDRKKECLFARRSVCESCFAH